MKTRLLTSSLGLASIVAVVAAACTLPPPPDDGGSTTTTVASTPTTVALDFTGPPGGAAKPCTPSPIGATFPAGPVCRNLLVDGYPRQYIVYTPAAVAAAPATPVPVVFMFHGSGQSGAQFYGSSGWKEKADEEGFVAVFPTGLQYFVTDKGHWQTKWSSTNLAGEVDATKRLPGYPAGAAFPASDVRFTNEMIDDVAAHHAVDDARIFVSGFSNGGAFSARLANEAGDRVAAVATTGSNAAVKGIVPGHDPAPLWQVVGSRDDKIIEATGVSPLPMEPDAIMAVPKLGTAINYNRYVYGLPEARCNTVTTPSITLMTWCADGRPDYQFTMVKGMFHIYPNGWVSASGPLVAADTFWTFFEQHPKAA